MFLFKSGTSTENNSILVSNLDPEGIVIPIGHGILASIQVIDNEHPYQVLPVLCPTYIRRKVFL